MENLEKLIDFIEEYLSTTDHSKEEVSQDLRSPS